MSSHDILGVSPKASKEEIRKAYHKLSMIYHPDRPDGNNEQFIKIKEAYDDLMDFNPSKTHDIFYETNSESVDCVLNWYSGDHLDQSFMLDNIIMIRLIANNIVYHTWHPKRSLVVTLEIPISTLRKCKFTYTLQFMGKSGTMYAINYSFKDPRNFVQKLIDYLFY